jgi:hypothetical protein
MAFVSNNDKLFPCEVISGTNIENNPTINKINNSSVVETASVFENLNRFLKNSTIGLAIIDKIIATIRYTITLCIWYKKYSVIVIKARKPMALKIPFAITFDVII